MYTMIIADDEEIECKAMSLLIQRNFPEITLLPYVLSGTDLIGVVDSLDPDIAIVDINMTGMNGLDAIDHIKIKRHRTKIIINTAYNSFEYAQRAILLGADAYILKPERKNRVIETISKICAEIDADRVLKAERERVGVLLGEMVPLMGNAILSSIVRGEFASKIFDSYRESLGISFERGVVITFAPFGGPSAIRSRASALRDFVASELSQYCPSITSESAGGKFHSFLMMEDKDGGTRWVSEMLSLVAERIKTKFGVTLVFGVGRIYSDCLEMNKSYIESLASFDLAMTNGGIRTYESLSPDPGESGSRAERPDREISSEGSDSRLAIALRHHPDFGGAEGPSPYIVEVVKYLNEDYAKNISLQELADRIGISSYYLSRIFKQELKTNFIDYLTELRIGKSIELISSTGLPIKEIASRVGYDNPAYFCKVFKKATGKTIREMRYSRGKNKN